jgi:hypothetical protein
MFSRLGSEINVPAPFDMADVCDLSWPRMSIPDLVGFVPKRVSTLQDAVD